MSSSIASVSSSSSPAKNKAASDPPQPETKAREAKSDEDEVERYEGPSNPAQLHEIGSYMVNMFRKQGQGHPDLKWKFEV